MSALTDRVDDLVHEPTQTEGPGLDLTVASVSRITEPGQVDFGGGELADPTLIEEVPEPRNEDDEYGWWSLNPGTYLVTHNESLATDEPLRLEPHPAITRRGATHPTVQVDSLNPVPLTTGGIQLKENARISTLYSP